MAGREMKNQQAMKLIHEKQDITNPWGITSAFNEYFVNISPKLAEKNCEPDQDHSDFGKYLPSCSTSFSPY